MTRAEWISRYAARMVQGRSWMTEAQAVASAEVRASASEQVGDTSPDDWESPEVVAEEDLASEARSQRKDTMTLMIADPVAAVNPLADLGANPDECLTRLVLGAKTLYIGLDLLAKLKSIAMEALAGNLALTIRDLVDAWVESPDAAINGVRDVAVSVADAYLAS